MKESSELKANRRAMFHENNRWPKKLKEVPKADWPEGSPKQLMGMFRSRDFLVQIVESQNGIMMVNVARTMIDSDGRRMVGGISHSTMQRIKAEIGLGDEYGLELYPPDKHKIDTAGSRFMWIMPDPIPFCFHKAPELRGLSQIHDPNEEQGMSSLLRPDPNPIIITG